MRVAYRGIRLTKRHIWSPHQFNVSALTQYQSSGKTEPHDGTRRHSARRDGTTARDDGTAARRTTTAQRRHNSPTVARRILKPAHGYQKRPFAVEHDCVGRIGETKRLFCFRLVKKNHSSTSHQFSLLVTKRHMHSNTSPRCRDDGTTTGRPAKIPHTWLPIPEGLFPSICGPYRVNQND